MHNTLTGSTLPLSPSLPDRNLILLHFRQTVFYTPSTIIAHEGDTVDGTLFCAPNNRNNRDLDITVKYTTPEGTNTKMDYKMCVILPPPLPLAGRLGTTTDRLSGLDCTLASYAFFLRTLLYTLQPPLFIVHDYVLLD